MSADTLYTRRHRTALFGSFETSRLCYIYSPHAVHTSVRARIPLCVLQSTCGWLRRRTRECKKTRISRDPSPSFPRCRCSCPVRIQTECDRNGFRKYIVLYVRSKLARSTFRRVCLYNTHLSRTRITIWLRHGRRALRVVPTKAFDWIQCINALAELLGENKCLELACMCVFVYDLNETIFGFFRVLSRLNR